MLKNDRYTYRVTWSETDGEHVGLCAGFPRLSWFAETPEKVLAGIRSIVSDVVADMLSDGDKLPEPLAVKKYSGKFLVRILPEQHSDLPIAAAETGVRLNRLAAARLCS